MRTYPSHCNDCGHTYTTGTNCPKCGSWDYDFDFSNAHLLQFTR